MTKRTDTPTLVSNAFENVFGDRPLAKQIEFCASDDMTACFVENLKNRSPVLEAGCGSGRWMHFLKSYGIEVIGLDWSQTLQQVSLQHDSTVRYDCGDLRNMPYPDNYFGGVLALGSIEHVIEGPAATLTEIYRVLRPGGVAIITVPYFSTLRRFVEWSSKPLRLLKHSNLVRRSVGRQTIRNLQDKSKIKAAAYDRSIQLDLMVIDGDIAFYQYQYTREQFSAELNRAGFRVTSLRANSKEEGIYHNFGRVAGKWNHREGQVEFTWLGKWLCRVLSVDFTGHMIGAIVFK